MKILVTGSAGLVGSHAVTELQKAGHTVIPYDLRTGQDIHATGQLSKAMAGCHTVVHLAAIPHPDKSKRWEDYYQANVQGTQKVAAVCAQTGVKRLVYASSTAYYGAHRGFPFDPQGGVREGAWNAVQRYQVADMPEMTRYNEAALAYACSKVAAETCLAAYGLSGRLEVVTLRFCPIIGTRTPYEWGLLLYVENAAAAIVKAVTMPGPVRYEVFNIANEDVTALNTGKWREAHE